MDLVARLGDRGLVDLHAHEFLYDPPAVEDEDSVADRRQLLVVRTCAEDRGALLVRLPRSQKTPAPAPRRRPLGRLVEKNVAAAGSETISPGAPFAGCRRSAIRTVSWVARTHVETIGQVDRVARERGVRQRPRAAHPSQHWLADILGHAQRQRPPRTPSGRPESARSRGRSRDAGVMTCNVHARAIDRQRTALRRRSAVEPIDDFVIAGADETGQAHHFPRAKGAENGSKDPPAQLRNDDRRRAKGSRQPAAWLRDRHAARRSVDDLELWTSQAVSNVPATRPSRRTVARSVISSTSSMSCETKITLAPSATISRISLNKA